jgi:hypothetical protein
MHDPNNRALLVLVLAGLPLLSPAMCSLPKFPFFLGQMSDYDLPQ